MKTINKYIIAIAAMLMMVSCYDGIDPITEVDPGPDTGAPIVSIISPVDGLSIFEPNPISTINIEINVQDDIEVGDITLTLDGMQIAYFSAGSYLDYRIVIKELTYDNIAIGDHTLTVTATDLVGNETTATTNFTKEPPYTPLYPGEILYMPFNGDFTDLVTSTSATEVGNPGFTSDNGISALAYQGAADSYLTFPSEGLAQGSNFSATFWLKVDGSDTRSGILNIAPLDPSSPSDKPSGFGLIREGSASAQKFILLTGNGDNATWLNPGDPATIDPTLEEWVHLGISISESTVALYLNGELAGQSDFAGIDWTDVGDLTIMSGGPNFSEWGHNTEKGQMDELRLYNTTLTQSEIQTVMLKDQAALYMSFNGNYKDAVSGNVASEVGNPSFNFSGGISGDAYQGAADSYLNLPSDELAQGSNFSAAFWLKMDGSDTRAGILNIAPAEPGSPSDKPSGFGLIREGSETAQKFILLAGNGSNATWLNPGDPATIDPTLDNWVHVGFVISEDKTAMYLDGALVGESDFPGIDWTGVGDLAIMSGDPNFSGWDHKTEKGQMDELFIFKKALSADEMTLLMNDGL
ncbi:LamG domain-containing protein [Winogradskyella sp. F6397]|uniref:LamG domain-containing protein n=1 Tax=Winogradskyella marina TaxID=2785530 RepID=A0ABS0EDU4_9FLAO|nr:LamG-like jellyroll fold domain-containing protein [Winogradskyella marina]MBF8148603.1 LamG domain-containing protein [Winogradskyella marina]